MQLPAQHDELVAAEAGNGVDLASEGREPAPDFGEDLVAGVVAERRVHLFEAVQADQQDRERPRVPPHGDKGLGHPVHQGGPVGEARHRVVQGLVGQGVLRVDLRGDVTGDPERAHYQPPVVKQRHLGGRHPCTIPAVEAFPLQLGHDRLAGADYVLLVLEGDRGVPLAEDVEVRLADHLLNGAARCHRGGPACADQQEAAEQVLEVNALVGGGQQVAHAGEL